MKSFVLAVLVCVSVCACSSSKSDSNDKGDASVTQTAGAAIGASGGTFTTPDGNVTLTVPPGALSGDVTFAVTPMTPAPDGANRAYEIGPTGTAFATPATLTLRYDAATLPSGTKVDDLRLATFDGTRWQPIAAAKVDAESSTVSADVEHLSPWGVVVTTSCTLPGCTITCAAPESASCTQKADGTASSGGTTSTPSCSCVTAPPPTDAGAPTCTGAEILCGDHCCPAGATCVPGGCMQ